MSNSHEFKALPLDEVRLAITFIPIATLSSAQIAALAVGLKDSVEWSVNQVQVFEAIEFRFKEYGIVCTFDGVKLDIVWKRSHGCAYPRFEAMAKCSRDVAMHIKAPVQIVSMTYAVVEPSMNPNFSDVGEWLDFGVHGQFPYSKFHNFMMSGRIDETNSVDLALNLFRHGDQGVVVETSCGSYTSEISSGLELAHNTLIDFFGKLISEKAKEAWQLK